MTFPSFLVISCHYVPDPSREKESIWEAHVFRHALLWGIMPSPRCLHFKSPNKKRTNIDWFSMNRNPGFTREDGEGGQVFCRTAKNDNSRNCLLEKIMTDTCEGISSPFTQFPSPLSQLINTSFLKVSCYFSPNCMSRMRTWRPCIAQWLASVGRVWSWLESWALTVASTQFGVPGLLITHKTQTSECCLCRNGTSRTAGFSDASSVGTKEWL